MLKTCECLVPVPYPSPRKAHQCVKCSFVIPAVWLSTDTTIKAFYDRLRDSAPSAPLDSLITHATRRERVGRVRYGPAAHLRRDNPVEALEEAADGGNYCFFETRQELRRGNGDTDSDLLFGAAADFAAAHEKLEHYRMRKGGAP